MRVRRYCFGLVLALTSGTGAAVAGPPGPPRVDPAGFVDPLIGAGGDGFTVPGATTPFGLTQVSPDTINPLAYTGYKYEDAAIRGFSLMHVDGAGVAMGADLPFLPVTAPVQDPGNPTSFAVPFAHATETATPGSYRVTLGNGITAELAATAHGAVQRFTPPQGLAFSVLADVGHNAAGATQASVRVLAPNRLEGSSLVHWRGGDYTAYFTARFSRDFQTGTTFVGSSTSAAPTAEGPGAGALLGFDGSGPVTMVAGVSLVDLPGARSNLAAELPHADLGGDLSLAQSAAHARWTAELSRVRVSGGSRADLRTFYSALYRTFLSPDVDSDVDGRYRGPDGRIHHSDQPHYENFSLWDTVRGEGALLATLQPARYRDMVASLSAFATEGGALPRWSLHSTHPDYMNGDPAIPTLADAVCRGIATAPDQLYEQARHLAFDLRPVDDLAKGYVPGSAADTLEYADADFALALMARRLGHTADATVLTHRSLAWQQLYHAGFLQPRAADGSWPASYDPMSGTGYREGTGWQYLWLAAHDEAGLQRQYEADGGGFASRLDHFFSVPASSTVPGLPVVPQVQSAETAFGTSYYGDQYVPGNEHDLEAPYAYAWTPRPSTGQAVLASERSLFNDTPYGLPGNDDLGSLSAWYVWAALGIYPPAAGAPMYVIGTPLFPQTTLALEGGSFAISAPGVSAQTPYVAAARLDGHATTRSWFTAKALRAGGRLTLVMAGSPTAWGSAVASRPPSVSTSDLAAFGC